MKPIILIFTAFYLPGYRGGGPIQTIANMVDCLSDDFDFRIVTSDRDLGDSNSYLDVVVDDWNSVGKATVFYMRSDFRLFSKILKIIRETPHDLIYLNSFFSSSYSLLPILGMRLGLVPKRPLIIAPRGEFSKGALNIKAWKKWPFIYLVRLTRFFYDVYWHASNDMESSDIRRSMFAGAERIHVAPNVTAAQKLPEIAGQLSKEQAKHDQHSATHLRVCFLSRISPKKNLDFALNILMKVKEPIEFRIFGPKEHINYWSKCQSLIACLPTNIKASYCGCVDHDQVKKIIGEHDIFFVPTLGENFGHVYIESFAAGVPVLVSDQTPWRNLESHGIGWDISLDEPELFIKVIEDAARLSLVKRHEISQKCLIFARQITEDSTSRLLNRTLFSKVLTMEANKIRKIQP